MRSILKGSVTYDDLVIWVSFRAIQEPNPLLDALQYVEEHPSVQWGCWEP